MFCLIFLGVVYNQQSPQLLYNVNIRIKAAFLNCRLMQQRIKVTAFMLQQGIPITVCSTNIADWGRVSNERMEKALILSA
jgi:hypothetical protein